MALKQKIKTAIKLLIDRRPKINVTVNVTTLSENSLLKGRCAIITGGTSGIGYAIAKAYINAGAAVVITGRNEKRINKTLDKLRTLSSEAVVIGKVLDNQKVDTFEEIFSFIKEEIKRYGINKIDILVNNAGVNHPGMPNATEEEYDQVLDTNLKGVFFLSQMFGKYLVDQGIKGNIFNIASSSSLRPADSAYTLSKWGIRGLTLGLAKALAKNGITVNGIAPGPTATPMMLKSNDKNMAHDKLPLGRYITPEEIANMAVILVSDMSHSIMGDIVYMTGGAGILTYDDVPYGF